ncbi:hypothetical protein PYJP_00450 [Pyrofollis japonicus]|nr:hypothetical protein PYJP_00450 [Pyrofollis japonicus]
MTIMVIAAIVILILILITNMKMGHELILSTPSTSKTLPLGTEQSTGMGNVPPKDNALRKCIGVSRLYCRLGYPVIIRPGFNISYAVKACNLTYVVGYAKYDILSLEEVLRKALKVLGENHSLVKAELEPGIIINNTLVKHPEWILTLSKTYKGYRLWPYGCCGDTRIIVDALNGSINVDYEANYTVPLEEIEQPSPEALARTDVTQLLIDTVRQVLRHYHGPWKEALRSMINNETHYHYMVDLRVAVLGTGSNLVLSNESVVAKELIGRPRLYWVIRIDAPEAHMRLTALVDAATNRLASYVIEPLWPTTPWATIVAEPVYPDKSATVGMNVKGLGKATIVLTKVYLVEPGEEGKLAIKLCWKTYGAEEAGEALQAIVVPELLASDGIRIEPVKTSIMVNFSETKSSELVYRYAVSRSVLVGIHVLPLHIFVKYVGEETNSRSLCVPIVFLVEGSSYYSSTR